MYSVFIPLALTCIPLYVAAGIIYLILANTKRRRIRTPLARSLLRAPGASLSVQIDELSDNINSYILMLSLIPLTVYSVYITQLYMEQVRAKPFGIFFITLLTLCALSFWLVKFIRAWKERRKLRLAHDGEIAVAEQLAPLMLSGYSVFHDFPAEKFNIDHIVVGQAGVFAVETKVRTKRPARNGHAEFEVEYNGKSLKFPSHSETKPLAQAQRQAKWLSIWLSSAVGETVKVSPILTLPGWYVKTVKPDGIPVLNPGQIQFYVAKKGQKLSPEMIVRIIHQLDQKCRDVGPKAFA